MDVAKQQVLENSNGPFQRSNDRTSGTGHGPLIRNLRVRNGLLVIGRSQLGSWDDWDDWAGALACRLGIPTTRQGSPLQQDLGSGLPAPMLPQLPLPFPFRALGAGRVTSAVAATVAVDSVSYTDPALNHDPRIVASTGVAGLTHHPVWVSGNLESSVILHARPPLCPVLSCPVRPPSRCPFNRLDVSVNYCAQIKSPLC